MFEELRQFLLDSNGAGYAGGETKQWIKESDMSTTIPFIQGDWKSHDNFFGGEPYGGRLVVFHENKPIWIMVYYGWVEESVQTDPIYQVLREALKLMPEEAPFRGPKELVLDDYRYSNAWDGDLGQYSGEESIFHQNKRVYKASYIGGIVDKRAGV